MKRLIGRRSGRKGILTKGKMLFATLAVAGIMGCNSCGARSLPETPEPSTTASEMDSETGIDRTPRDEEGPFDIGYHSLTGEARERYCYSFPEIEAWSERRGLDPSFTRAIVAMESGFDECAAAKVCASGFDGAGCFEPGPAEDPGYRLAYDEMHDPTGTCSEDLVNAPNQSSYSPAWRFLALGLMQTLEPPYTFWPASHHPMSMNGPFFDVFSRSGLGDMSLDDAKNCNPIFNPFDASDSICLGTSKLSIALEQARAWISANRDLLNWGPHDAVKDEAFAFYVAAHIYEGTWQSSTRSASHPRCSSSISNGDCWTRGFNESWRVSEEYCQPDENGQVPVEECDREGMPRVEPPGSCYGYDNIIRFINDCELPYIGQTQDIGRRVLELYYMIRNGCRPGSSEQSGYQHPLKLPPSPQF